MRVYEYRVRGLGRFPVDMLRYDGCWPRTEEDSCRVAMSFSGDRPWTQTEVDMQGIQAPTEGRWTSFGWRVEGTVRTRRTVPQA